MVDRLKFYWFERETAAQSMTSSTDFGPHYDASYSADVRKIHLVGPNSEIWKWSVEYVASARSATICAHGYTRTMEAGKLAAENACNRIHVAFLPEGSDKEATKEAARA